MLELTFCVMNKGDKVITVVLENAFMAFKSLFSFLVNGVEVDIHFPSVVHDPFWELR